MSSQCIYIDIDIDILPTRLMVRYVSSQHRKQIARKLMIENFEELRVQLWGMTQWQSYISKTWYAREVSRHASTI